MKFQVCVNIAVTIPESDDVRNKLSLRKVQWHSVIIRKAIAFLDLFPD